MLSITQFAVSQGGDDERCVIRVPEHSAEEYGMYVWPSAVVLAGFLGQHPDCVHGKVVLELGAGVGLVGLVAARLGARKVTITDRPDLPHVRENEELACELNSVTHTVQVVRDGAALQ